MIMSFRHKGLKDFFETESKKGIRPEHADRLDKIIDLLDISETVENMRFPGSGVHKLEPKSENRWSVKVSGNWRITFVFEKGNGYEVDYLDYH